MKKLSPELENTDFQIGTVPFVPKTTMKSTHTKHLYYEISEILA